MKRSLIQRIIDFFFSHEEQAANLVKGFNKTLRKFEVLDAKIVSKTEEELKEVERLQKSIEDRNALAAKNAKIRDNFKKLLAED